jgi:flagellar capping protein FliD
MTMTSKVKQQTGMIVEKSVKVMSSDELLDHGQKSEGAKIEAALEMYRRKFNRRERKGNGAS